MTTILELLTFFSLLLSGAFAQVVWNLNCTDNPQACNNDCYGVYVQKLPTLLDWDVPNKSTKDARRRVTCGSPSPCTCQNSQFARAGTQCDEYPYASTKQGGSSKVVLRCIDRTDNGNEGNDLKYFLYSSTDKYKNTGCHGQPCQFTVMFDSASLSNSPFCTSKTGPNDGQEFYMSAAKQYTAYRRDETLSNYTTEVVTQNQYRAHNDTGETFPPHMRREFLLSDGRKVLWLSTNTTHTFNTGHQVGDAVIVRELFVQEKSLPFRPSQ